MAMAVVWPAVKTLNITIIGILLIFGEFDDFPLLRSMCTSLGEGRLGAPLAWDYVVSLSDGEAGLKFSVSALRGLRSLQFAHNHRVFSV